MLFDNYLTMIPNKELKIKGDTTHRLGFPIKFTQVVKNVEKFLKIPNNSSSEDFPSASPPIQGEKKREKQLSTVPLFQTYVFMFLCVNFLAVASSDFPNSHVLELLAKPTLPFSQPTPIKNILHFQLYSCSLSCGQNLSEKYVSRQLYNFTNLILLQNQFVIQVPSKKTLIQFLQLLEKFLLEQKNKKIQSYLKFFNPTVLYQGNKFFLKFQTYTQILENSSYWSKFGLNLFMKEERKILQYFLKICKVRHLVNLCIEEKKMVLHSGESKKGALREKMLNMMKKNDRDGNFFDYLERKSFQFLDQIKKTKKEFYLPLKRQKRKCDDQNSQHDQMTVIYEEERQCNEDQFFSDLLPQLSPLSRTTSQLVENRQRNEYKSLKNRYCLKTVHELGNNCID